MSGRIFVGLIAALVSMVLVQRGLSWSIPGYSVMAPSLLLLAAMSYVPLLMASVREGEISVPPQTVFRHDKPVFFWVVVATHVLFTLGTIAGTAATLLGWIG